MTAASPRLAAPRWVGAVESMALRARCRALLTDGGGRAELLGYLGRGETEHFAQDQRRPLKRGQVLQRRDERELDALARKVLGLGGEAGVGLEPLISAVGVPGVTSAGDSASRPRWPIAVRHRLVVIL